MFTFEDQYELAQEISGLEDAASLIKFKRDINNGGKMMMSLIDRPFNRRSKFANIVADQQYYQMSGEAQRTIGVTVHDGSTHEPLTEVTSEDHWRDLISSGGSGAIATDYFIRGDDEIGIYPKPSGAISAGLEHIFEPKHVNFSEADFNTGTVTVTEGDATITHSGTGFTADMVGQGFQVTDGTDQHWYRVASFTSTSILELDNVYEGRSGSGRTFRIGQVFYLPDEFLESPVDYAMYRHYLKSDRAASADFKSLFEDAVKRIRMQYGKKTSSNVVSTKRNRRRYNPLTDTPPAIA